MTMTIRRMGNKASSPVVSLAQNPDPACNHLDQKLLQPHAGFISVGPDT
jgi:hypothetical protein